MAKLSVITAMYNEAANVPEFRRRATKVLDSLDVDWEIVIVDDHSRDETRKLVKAWVRDEPRVQYARLARNCGSHAAFSAGMHLATGDCATLLAADLQDPPETIAALVGQWREGSDVVWAARREHAKAGIFDDITGRLYYRLMRWLAFPEMPRRGADFLLLDRKVIDAYDSVPEKNTSFLAMIHWLGFKQTTIEYDKQPRHAGKSGWTLSKKVKLFVDSIVSFSDLPIRLITVCGALLLVVGVSYALVLAALGLWGNAVQGWSVVIAVVLGVGGIQLMSMGVLGEYLWRAYDEARGRPRYVIEERVVNQPK